MSDLEVGSVLAKRYRIEAKLGEGGMAVVYRAYDLQRRVMVAIKSLKADYAEDDVFLQRFKREARSLQRLQHPNIVRFYEFTESGILAFMVLDYIDGMTLRRVMKLRGQLFQPGEVLGYLRPICAALSYAHSERVIHCDMKPANVMVDSRGMVYLSDFGIARLSESATMTFSTPGTALYMAPEQWRGGEDVYPATDVYALGVMLYEMLTGQQPFTGETIQTRGTTRDKVMHEHFYLTPPPASQLSRQVSPAFDTILLKCLAKDAEERYRDVDQLCEAFEAACRQLNIAEVPVVPLSVMSPTVMLSNLATPIQPLPSPGASSQGTPTPASPTTGAGPSVAVGVGVGVGLVTVLGLGALVLVIVGIVVFGKGLHGTTSTQISQKTPTDVVNVSVELQPTKLTWAATLSPLLVETPSATLEPTPIVVRPTETPYPTDTLVPTATSTPIPDWGATQVSAITDGIRVFVPAGNFLAGMQASDPGAKTKDTPQHTIYLGAFWIDQTEVTNAMFERFVKGTGYVTQAEKGQAGWVFVGGSQPLVERYGVNWRTPGPGSAGAGLEYPVIQVTWRDARAYCKWAGGDLPSALQWEKAARGTDGRRYPWAGAGITDNQANLADLKDGFSFDAPVGKYTAGASPAGALDMLGNVWEWARDEYVELYYATLSEGASNPPISDCHSQCTLRGGSWYESSAGTRATQRMDSPINRPWVTVGFRCVYLPAP